MLIHHNYMEDLNISNTTKLYTLLLLETEPKHGYQIIDDLEQITGKDPQQATYTLSYKNYPTENM